MTDKITNSEECQEFLNLVGKHDYGFYHELDIFKCNGLKERLSYLYPHGKFHCQDFIKQRGEKIFLECRYNKGSGGFSFSYKPDF